MDATVRRYYAEGSAERIADRVNGRQRLREALERVRVPTRPQRTALSNQGDLHPSRRHFLSAYYRGGLQTVAIENIHYLRAEHKYVTVRHTGGEILVDESLKSLEEEFPDLFVRIHRNALVARSGLSGLSKASDGGVEVRLRDCTEHLPVSRSHLASIRRLLLNGFHGVRKGPDFPLGDSMLAHVTVELPIEIRDRLTRASERTGKNVAGIVERALREELERLEREGI